MKNHYKILGLTTSATAEVILAAYKALIRKYDPLNNPSLSAERAGEVAEIIEAYSVLSDRRSKDLYDEQLSKYELMLKDTQRDSAEELIKNEKIDHEWEMLSSFDKERQLKKIYHELKNINAQLAEEFKLKKVKERNYKVKDGELNDILIQHITGKYALSGNYIVLFALLLLKDNQIDVVEKLSATFHLLGDQVEEIEIIQNIASQFECGNAYYQLSKIVEKDQDKKNEEELQRKKEHEERTHSRQIESQKRKATEAVESDELRLKIYRRKNGGGNIKYLIYILIFIILISIGFERIKLNKPTVQTQSSANITEKIPPANKPYRDINYGSTIGEVKKGVPSLVDISEAYLETEKNSGNIVCINQESCISIDQIIEKFFKVQDSNLSLHIRLSGKYFFNVGGSTYLLVAMDTLRGGDGFDSSTCHVCAPKMTFLIFKQNFNSWSFVGKSPADLSYGSWGESYVKSINNIKIYHFGEDKFQIGISGGYMAQGIVDNFIHWFSNNSSKSNDFKSLGSSVYATDGCGFNSDGRGEELFKMELLDSKEKYPMIKFILSLSDCDNKYISNLWRFFVVNDKGYYEMVFEGDGSTSPAMTYR